MRHTTDLELSASEVAQLTNADALAAFFDRLGYQTGSRAVLAAEGIGYLDTERAIHEIQLLAEDEERLLRVLLIHVRSVTAKIRLRLTRILGRLNEDYLLVLTPDFEQFEFVLIDKLKRHTTGSGRQTTYSPVAKTFGFNRKQPDRSALRTLRRLTFTAPDGLFQYDKIRHAFDAAVYWGRYFQNRALFADHYLDYRLRELPAWRENPTLAFTRTSALLTDAPRRFLGHDQKSVRETLYQPIFDLLGFSLNENKPPSNGAPAPHYLLSGPGKENLTAALVYRWDRWLDGPDYNDPDTPGENPGASVVSLLEAGIAKWIIVTNGRLWRLYSAKAHSRSTNFFEVDLEEVLTQAGDTDPNEAFRYWWLFFRREAFEPSETDTGPSWLDFIAAESRAYAKEVEAKLKRRVFEEVVPQLAAGFLADRRNRLGHHQQPTEAELEDIRQATLTLLYRVLFLLYAEARQLLPVRESTYNAISLESIKQRIADTAGAAETDADDHLAKGFKVKATKLYDHLAHLFSVMDRGDAAVNVPQYNGKLFWTCPPEPDTEGGRSREAAIARFLNEHKVPDRHLAPAIDRLARVPDDKTCALVFVDYKSMGVRQLGSIYEGLLEYRLAIAVEDLTTEKAKGKERYIPLSKARGKKTRRSVEVVVSKGEPYLTTDNAERKATGSYYTPDTIVEYIVEHTVGPVLDQKLEALRPAFRKAEKTWHTACQNAKADPKITKTSLAAEPRHRDEYAREQTFLKHRDLIEEMFSIRVLDPAMGSGHFLVESVDFITDRIIDFLNRFPRNPIYTALAHTRGDIIEACEAQGVSIDPCDDRLNDVHLLKRHVLKRCIYGVDLNPLACELAKVSLWLDAFTLGAPLSFLDHHLRPGNALVGAWFTDLEKATEEQLFGIDYEPLKRAIGNVLLISGLSDATAAEARQSADRYAQARHQLDTYRLIFDLLTAEHFGHRDAPEVITHIRPDFEDYERFLRSLPKDDLPLVRRVEEVAAARRFFHWELEFPEVFFELGSEVGLKASTQQLKKRPDDQRGFDAIVGNPPYDSLSSKELGYDISDFQSWITAQSVYDPSRVGKNNLYKLFICRAFDLLHDEAQMGFITPMAVLGDQQASRIRQLLIDRGAFRAIEVFPQKDDPERRVFPEAKLSTALFVAMRTQDEALKQERFCSRVHPAQYIDTATPSLLLSSAEIPIYDRENLTIVSCRQEDWDLATRLIASGRMGRLGDFCEFSQGEVNETVQRAKGNLTTPDRGVLVVRGASLCLYTVRPASQGEDLYLDRESFLEHARADAKAFDYQYPRVGVQESSPQNNFRRIIASYIPVGSFCNHKVNYVPECDARIPLQLVLAALNSRLADWFFRLGSTNAAVSHYQLNNIPCPEFLGIDSSSEVSRELAAIIEQGRLEEVTSFVAQRIGEPPYPGWLLEVICNAVDRIIRIENERGDIRRAERSALAVAAQPYQQLIDRLFYLMAGLSDEEACALEHRLSTML